MRLRHKHNLNERLESCSDVLLSLICTDLDSRNEGTGEEMLDLQAIYGNANPLHLEIGCGKGQFACELASREPNINLLAVEMLDNVIVCGCERAKPLALPNLRFACTGAEYLGRYLPEKSVSVIYLNFSCPYPKGGNTRQRLTSPRFLALYRRLLREDGAIYLKTDNQGFFEYSLETLSEAGFTLRNISLNLHASGYEGNIVTEYEQRFTSMGLPIYRLEAYI